jgi:hypothetical protein
MIRKLVVAIAGIVLLIGIVYAPAAFLMVLISLYGKMGHLAASFP